LSKRLDFAVHPVENSQIPYKIKVSVLKSLWKLWKTFRGGCGQSAQISLPWQSGEADHMVQISFSSTA
jgi:hypothetical protein